MTVSQSEGWKLALSGEGVMQNMGPTPIFVKKGTDLPTDDSNQFYKKAYEEVQITDPDVNLYVRTSGLETCTVSVWAV